jgi:hypothetical protein
VTNTGVRELVYAVSQALDALSAGEAASKAEARERADMVNATGWDDGNAPSPVD